MGLANACQRRATGRSGTRRGEAHGARAIGAARTYANTNTNTRICVCTAACSSGATNSRIFAARRDSRRTHTRVKTGASSARRWNATAAQAQT